MRRSLLIVDDEMNIRKFIQIAYKEEGCQVYVAKNGFEAMKILNSHFVDVVVTDKKLPDIDGLELIKKIRTSHPSLYVIMITAYGDIETAVLAMKSGAFDFLSKPFTIKELKKKVEPIFKMLENRHKEGQVASEKGFHGIISFSEEMKHIFFMVQKVAQTKSTVLITGETGTGKELIAHAIHKESQRKEKPFVAINCSALPENILEAELFGYEKGAFTDAKELKKGLCEVANKGTLFLDEVGDMSASLQAKLLRVLQEQSIRRVGGTKDVTVDIRVLAATHRNLKDMIEKKEFREDLFFRLNVFPIELPPLRKRKEDIIVIAETFCKELVAVCQKKKYYIPKAVKMLLCSYDWPGNVRELRNILERAMILSSSGKISIENLPLHLQRIKADEPAFFHDSFRKEKARAIDLFERRYIKELLEQTGGNISMAANIAQMNRTVLQRLIKKHQIDRKSYRL